MTPIHDDGGGTTVAAGPAAATSGDGAPGDGAPAAPGTEQTTDWAALGELLSPVTGKMIAAGILAFIGSGMRLVPAIAVAEIAIHHDGLTGGFVAGWLVAAAACLLVGQMLYLGAAGWCHGVEADYRRDLRLRVSRHLSRIPLGWFSDRNSGTVKKIVREDVASIHTIVAHLPADGASAVAMPLAGFGILFWYDWRFALGLIVWIALVFTLTAALNPGGMKETTEKYLSAQASMSQALVELVDGITAVKNFGGSGRVFGRYERALDHFVTWTGDWMTSQGKSQSVSLSLLNPAGMLVPTVLLGWAVIGWGGADPALMVPFVTVALGLPMGLIGFIPLMRFLTAGSEAARRLSLLLAVEPLPVPAEPTPIPDGPLDVEFDHVTFGYDARHPVIRDLTVTFAAGTVTALVGPSGSGKTTVTRLAARFHDVEAGAVRLGGVDVRDADDADVLAHLAIVEQDIALIHGSAAENIALGRPGATREEIEAAARAARIHDRITRLPGGYDAVLGDEGTHLSGGEKQRVALARAFLRDAPVLLLDEATAWADPHSEREIQEALADLAAGRTVIVVAHRLATIVGADRILVLDAGRVVEDGTHDELAAAGGLYSTLREAQR